MKTQTRNSIDWPKPVRGRAGQRGFTFAEMLVALAAILIVAGAAWSLFNSQQPLYREQQNQARLNLSLRNAASQFQLDVANGATVHFVGVNIPNIPIGVTIVNNDPASETSCYTASTHAYTATCFDMLNVIAANSRVPPLHPTDIGTNCVSTTSSTLFGLPVPGDTAAQDASYFKRGAQLLLIKADGSQFATVVMTKDAQATGGKIQMQHNPTGADGTNTAANDPLGISANPMNKLGTTFCDKDWILEAAPVQYWVDASDPTNPKLMRAQLGSTDVLAQQVIGFKVGATIWNGTQTTSSTDYDYSAADYGYDWALVRTIRISLIGRTTPNNDSTFVFRNAFDGGTYEIQGASIVINPRSLSMKD